MICLLTLFDTTVQSLLLLWFNPHYSNLHLIRIFTSKRTSYQEKSIPILNKKLPLNIWIWKAYSKSFSNSAHSDFNFSILNKIEVVFLTICLEVRKESKRQKLWRSWSKREREKFQNFSFSLPLFVTLFFGFIELSFIEFEAQFD